MSPDRPDPSFQPVLDEQVWLRVAVLLPIDCGDLASLICWETDALGGEEIALDSALQAVFYYPAQGDPGQLEERISALCAGAGVEPSSFSQTLVEAPADRWISAFKEHFKGIMVGGFFVHPPWIPGRAGKRNLQIDPSHAFGTGTHESTQLILRDLPRSLSGMSGLLDVGTGSGILAIGAHLVSPGLRILGIDIDEDAVTAAGRNAAANRAAIPLAVAEPAAILRPWDLVLANLTRPLIQLLADDLARLTRRRLVTSGFTTDEEILVREAFQSRPGWKLARRRESRGWVCLQFERTSTPEHSILR